MCFFFVGGGGSVFFRFGIGMVNSDFLKFWKSVGELDAVDLTLAVSLLVGWVVNIAVGIRSKIDRTSITLGGARRWNVKKVISANICKYDEHGDWFVNLSNMRQCWIDMSWSRYTYILLSRERWNYVYIYIIYMHIYTSLPFLMFMLHQLQQLALDKLLRSFCWLSEAPSQVMAFQFPRLL